MPGPFGCGATKCDPEMGRNTLDQHFFFVCTPAPEAWHGRCCKNARRAWAIQAYKRGRVGAVLDGLNRGSQMLGIWLSRYPHSTVLSHQR